MSTVMEPSALPTHSPDHLPIRLPFRPTVIDPSKRKSRIYFAVDGLTIQQYHSDGFRSESNGYVNPSTALTFAQLSVDLVENRRETSGFETRDVTLLMGQDVSSVWLAVPAP